MPPAPAKTLSPAELAKLEHAFATDPASEAYKPLAEAYLGMGRFMEAMVVCKKGVKAHPNTPDARMLLARVYADQGKDKKALEELAGALQVAPADKNVLRMTGALQLKSGEAAVGKENLLKAWQADPEDADTKAALAQYKIETPKPAAPEPPTERNPVGPPPGQGAQYVPPRSRGEAPTAGPGTRGSGQRPAPPPLAQTREDRPVPTNGAPRQAPARAPAQAQRRPSQIRTYEEEPVSEASMVPRKSKGKSAFVFLLVIAVVGSAGYFAFGQWRAKKIREVNKALTQASDQLKHDSFDSYKRACEAAEKALDADPSSAKAHAYLAYAWAIRWGEHGGGDEAKQQAEDHLAAAKKSGDLPSDFPYMTAADALIKTYSGKGTEALKDLDEAAKNNPSAILLLTLGIIQMNAGDFEHSRDNLIQAQQLASSDARTYAALGTLFRRRGEDDAAFRNYDSALKFERDHAESVLGFALLMLEREQPQYEAAAKGLKKVLESDPPASPRQLATAHLARAFLVSKVNADLQGLKPDEQKAWSDKTLGVPVDKAKAQQEIAREEENGFSLDRNNPDLHLIKGRRLLAENQNDAAVAEYRAAIKMDPGRANYYVEVAKAYMKADKNKEAADALGDAIHRMGESPKLMVMLAQVYRKLDKLDDAIAQLKRSLSDPKAKNPEARFILGSIYIQQKKCQDAVDALSKAAQEYVGQKTRVAMADEELGRAYECLNDREKAESAYLKALGSDDGYAPAYYFYGKYLLQQPITRPKGIKLLQHYLELDPNGAFAPDAKHQL